MKNNTFRTVTAITSALLGATIAISVSKGNFIITLVLMAISTALIATLKLRVSDVPLTDERIDKVAGKAARTVYIIMTYLFAIATVVFAALSKSNSLFSGYMAITSIVCMSMLLLYMAAFAYYNKKRD